MLNERGAAGGRGEEVEEPFLLDIERTIDLPALFKSFSIICDSAIDLELNAIVIIVSLQ
jgi:hypothetical protein